MTVAAGEGITVLRVGVIGCGYWGPNLIRNFFKDRRCQVVAAADPDPERLDAIRHLYPGLRLTTAPAELLASPEIDAVAVATPIRTHFELGQTALQAGKHLLIEKPLAASVAQAEELIDLAERNRRVLMVDHTFVYAGAVRKIREIIGSGALGQVYYYDSVRVNLGLFQHDANVLWDLAPHDFSIMTYLVDKAPVRVTAIGASPVRWQGWNFESIVYVAVEFGDGTLAHFHVNWLSPTKVRRTLIGGSQKMIIYDHLDADNQVKVFDEGVEIRTDRERYKALVEYRTGDMFAPKVDQTEALELACRHFIDCVQTAAPPLTDGHAGLRVVQLLEAADRSLAEHASVRL